MTYAELLESSRPEVQLNIPLDESFESLDNYLSENFSMYLNESSDYLFTIEEFLDESYDEYDIFSEAEEASKGGKFKAAINKIIAKIKEFFVKIKDALARLIFKAKSVIQIKINGHLAKTINKHPDATVKKDIDIKVFNGKVDSIIDTVERTSDKVDSHIQTFVKLANGGSVSKFIDSIGGNHLDKEITDLTDTLGKPFEKDTSLTNALTIKKGENASSIYNKYYKDAVSTATSCIDKCKKVITKNNKKLSECEKGLKKLENQTNTVSKLISEASNISNNLMKLSTSTMKFSVNVLKVCATNANKLILNMKDPKTGKDIAEKA